MEESTIKIFISYSHHDSEYLADDSLLGHLRGLESECVEFWHEEKIATGENWNEEIQAKIQESHIAILLVSEALLNSEYCANEEIPRFLERNRETGLILFPIILSACEWQRHAWLRDRQCFPTGDRTIEEDYTKKGKRRRLFHDIKQHLRRQIERIRANTRQSMPQTQGSSELRQVTVMHCKLALESGSLNLNELFDVWPKFQSLAEQVISRFDGYLGQASGSALLVYFGYPLAHDDDARRAIHAALALVEQTIALSLECGMKSRRSVALRTGIHSGPVLVTIREGNGEELILGATPDLASQIGEKCPQNSILVSGDTYELTETFFSCEFVGLKNFKGTSKRIRIYRVCQEVDFGTGSTQAERRLVPMVARTGELNLLLTRWNLSEEGQGQVVLLRGDAGIGKTRLVRELKNQLNIDTQNFVILRCSPYYQSSALFIFINALQRLVEAPDSSDQEIKVQRLEEIISRYGMSIEETAPLMASLLSLPTGQRYPPVNLSPQGQRRKTVRSLISIMLGMAQKKPALIVIEDAHWIDPSSLELLGLLMNQIPTTRILLIVTYRPEFQPPWEQRAYLTQLTLAPLTGKQMEELIMRLVGGISLSNQSVEQIIVRADGVPLYVEELTKRELSISLPMEQTPALSQGMHPPTALQSSLMARLDRLGSAKKVAQIASVLGREFSYKMLRAVSPFEESKLQMEVDRLIEAELLYARGIPPQIRYIFKHALIRDAAYHSLINQERRSLHERFARTLEGKFAEEMKDRPELLAYHYSETECTGKAIHYWHLAGENAMKRSANEEAINHLTRSLEMLENLPDSQESMQLEMQAQIALGQVFTAYKGYGAEEVETAYRRAWDLCLKVGDDQRLFRVLRGLLTFLQVRAKLLPGLDLATQCLDIAERCQESALLMEANRAMGNNLFYLGKLDSALSRFEKVLAVYNPKDHCSHIDIYGHEPGVCCLSNESLALWLLGYPDTALEKSHTAIDLARRVNHPYNLAYALFFATWLHIFRREMDLVQDRAEELFTLASANAFQFWESMSIAVRGWVSIMQDGADSTAVKDVERGVSGWKDAGAELFLPVLYCLLAQAYQRVGKIKEGLDTLDEALAMTRKNSETYYAPEIHRLFATMLQRQGAPLVEVEAGFRLAVESARQGNSKSLELRAMTDLIRLSDGKNRSLLNYEELLKLLDWFTEGNQTVDLREARCTLDAYR